MRCERVPQGVGMQVRTPCTKCSVLAHQVLHLPYANAFAQARNKKCSRIDVFRLGVPKFVSTHHPLRQRGLGERTNGHDAFLATFADHARASSVSVELDVTDIQSHEFRHAKSRAVEDFEHGAIALTFGGRFIGRFDDFGSSVDVDERW